MIRRANLSDIVTKVLNTTGGDENKTEVHRNDDAPVDISFTAVREQGKEFQAEEKTERVRIGPKGYMLPKNYVSMASDIYNLKLRTDDITVASFQRSGTTLTQELIWLIINNLNYENASEVSLVHRYNFLEIAAFFKRNPDIENVPLVAKEVLKKLSTPATANLPNIPSPRFIKTHLPMSLLPPTLVDTTKVVYIARDPRDVAVSCYHHAKLLKDMIYKGSFKDFWNDFINDFVLTSPYFEHVKEAWELRNHPNMLFMFYENILKDLPASIRRVASFLGKELTVAQVDRLCEHLHIDNFKNNKSVNHEELRECGLFEKDESFIRQGKVGGWRDYFDEEMCSQAERWIADNLRDTDLRFPSMMEESESAK